jgi:hypothetical protein
MLSTQAIATANGLSHEIVQEQYHLACSAGLGHHRALAVTATLAAGIVEERARLGLPAA